MASYFPNQLFQVPRAELQPDPTQPRNYMDPMALDELTASVGKVGIIQPIVCRQDPATGLVYVVALPYILISYSMKGVA
jgi:ParB-like chromosome segregation protein Spo0J